MKSAGTVLVSAKNHQAMIHSPLRARGNGLCEELEQGKVLFFQLAPFRMTQSDHEFLLGLNETPTHLTRNVYCLPGREKIRGIVTDYTKQHRLLKILQAFSHEVTELLPKLFPAYAGDIKPGFTSFRPLDAVNQRKPNGLLHIDAFPKRPTWGARILGVSFNVNPGVSRVWNVGEPFHALLPKLLRQVVITPRFANPVVHQLIRMGNKIGLPLADRSYY